MNAARPFCRPGAMCLALCLLAIVLATSMADTLPVAIDVPLPTAQNTSNVPVPSAAASAGRRRLQSCTDQRSECPSWATSGYCDAKYVLDNKSVRDVVCAKSCKGAPCAAPSCIDQYAQCSTWASQGYCAASYVIANKSVRDVACPKSCNGAPCGGIVRDKLGCYKQAYGRGAGSPLNTCPPNTELSGALCYPKCNAGYRGVGPMCWQDCPSGFRDDGAFCAKPAAYGRGAGYALWDWNKCNRENNNGCEQWGALYYPKCSAGFEPVGCCICSPVCQLGMTNIGVSCAKKSYGRGSGVALWCSSDQDQDVALCYPKCRSGYTGVGPVCWQSSDKCPTAYPFNCGPICAASQASCTSISTTVGTTLVNVGVNAAALAGCAVATFATLGAAAACWGPAIALTTGTAVVSTMYWTDNFVMC